MNILTILKKQGGINLLKQYIRSGVFHTAAIEFCTLGKSRTALELLRLSTQLKIKQKLKRRYYNLLVEFDKKNSDNLPHYNSNKVWICWFQGIGQAPDIVKVCYKSVKKNMPDKDIIVITAENMSSYVQFPDYIMDKWNKGYITHTHMTDLLRLELLIKYGGLWLDATVYCSSNKVEDYYTKSDLFFFQKLKPGRDGNSIYMSSWLMSARSNNKILMAVRQLCYEYWKSNTKMLDYYLFHYFVTIALEFYKNDWHKIPPKDSATPHILLLRLFDRYDETTWNIIINQTPFHKLSYKINPGDIKKEGTNYRKLMTGLYSN